MKRQNYLKPTMQVVELRHTGMLMTSGFGATRDGYDHGNSSDPSSSSTEEEVWP